MRGSTGATWKTLTSSIKEEFWMNRDGRFTKVLCVRDRTKKTGNTTSLLLARNSLSS